jgi:hypothetical protein
MTTYPPLTAYRITLNDGTWASIGELFVNGKPVVTDWMEDTAS